jgi:hypothetical protein
MALFLLDVSFAAEDRPHIGAATVAGDSNRARDQDFESTVMTEAALLHQLVTAAALRDGDRTALTFGAAGVHYATLSAHIEAFASAFSASGCRAPIASVYTSTSASRRSSPASGRRLREAHSFRSIRC